MLVEMLICSQFLAPCAAARLQCSQCCSPEHFVPIGDCLRFLYGSTSYVCTHICAQLQLFAVLSNDTSDCRQMCSMANLTMQSCLRVSTRDPVCIAQ